MKKTNPFEERDLTTQLLFPTISWSSLSQFLYYDREQWYQCYVLGVRGGINPAMEAGIEIGERWATDETFLTEVPRRPEIFEHTLKVKLGAITLTGHMDGWSPSIKELSELKTAQNKNKWNEKSVREHGQLDFYALLLWLHDKIRPEDISMRLIAVPVEMSGDFKVKQCGPAQIIPTSRNMLDIATFGALIKKTHKEMQLFINMKQMKILSLFDGISCARVALERAGIPVEAYYASEIDKYAMQISAKNYPDIVQLGGVVGVNGFKFGSETYGLNIVDTGHRIDLLIGGSPCQDLSIAKKDRKGLDGERSGLFWEYVRILKEVKPKYFILENVNSMPKEAKALITETLGVEPIMINAALVSAQNRKRLFWTNIPNVTLPEDRGILLKDILEKDVDEKYFVNTDNTLTPSTNKDLAGTLDEGTWSKRYEQIRRVYKTESKSPTIPTGTGGGVMTKIAVPVALRNRGEGKKPEYNGTDKANSMTTVQTDSMVEVNTQIRKLTPTECERLQSLPDNYTDGVSNSQRYKMLGNAFNVDVVSWILSFIPKV